MLGVLLLFKILRNLIEFKPFKNRFTEEYVPILIKCAN